MKITAEPRSDQYNADDFLAGPRDFIIAGVRRGTAEQKYDVQLVGEERVWRPPLTVLRLLMAAWGDEAATWAGRGVRLFNDPDVSFGRDKTGGIRVSHMSHLPGDRPLTINPQRSRGKRGEVTVEPLPRVDLLRAEWQGATPERRAEIETEVKQLESTREQFDRANGSTT